MVAISKGRGARRMRKDVHMISCGLANGSWEQAVLVPYLSFLFPVGSFVMWTKDDPTERACVLDSYGTRRISYCPLFVPDWHMLYCMLPMIGDI